MSAREVSYTAYGLLAGLAIVLEATARRRPDRLPTLGAVLTWAMRRRATQFGLVLAWWWLGWHFVTDR